MRRPVLSVSPRTLAAFFAKVSYPDGLSGCWVWVGARNEGGYPICRNGDATERAHRVAYEWFVGEIPDGLALDHLCRRRACVNPDHLEAVTAGENSRRALAMRPKRTTCAQGHELIGANRYFERRADGQVRVRCLFCRRALSRDGQRRRAAERKAMAHVS